MVITNETIEYRPPRKKGPIIAAAIVALLVVVAATFFLTRQLSDSDDQADPAPSRPTPTTTPSTSTPNGLAIGDATVNLSSATKQIGTQPRGFPQTPAGAVEAFTGVTNIGWTYTTMSDQDIAAYLADAAPQFDPNTLIKDAAQRRAEDQLDETGQFIGPEGQRSYQECLPEYGAYKQDVVNPTTVEVGTWMPCISGVGSPDDIDGLIVAWVQAEGTVRWTGGDWRYNEAEAKKGVEAPLPQNKNRVDVSFTERAQILGPDWKLYQGGTQVWPDDLLGPEPSA